MAIVRTRRIVLVNVNMLTFTSRIEFARSPVQADEKNAKPSSILISHSSGDFTWHRKFKQFLESWQRNVFLFKFLGHKPKKIKLSF